MSIERLTPEDEVMLWPDQVWPQDIGAVAVLDASNALDPSGQFRIEAVRQAVAARLHLVPRFRQILFVPHRRLGAPVWTDDLAFDLTRHVGSLQLPRPGGEAQLLQAIEDLRRRRLERSRPLWEIWFLTGMSESRLGMFVRMHHAMADGIAGVATLGAFLDATPDVIPVPAQPWTPTPAPTEEQLLADDRRRRRLRRQQTMLALRHPVAVTRSLLAMAPAIRELFAEPALPAPSLDHVVGSGRAFTLIRGSLETVKAIAHAYNAKVNDVLLTVIAGGLRTLLLDRGEAVNGAVIRIYVPVSLRHGQYSGARGNHIAQMTVPLPIGLADPVRRLRQITAETTRRKARTRPSVGRLPTRGFLGRAALKLIERQHVNVESADLPGPPVALYFAGMRLLEVFPLLPLIGKVSLGVGGLSYDGQFNIAAVGDGDRFPDIDIFAAGLKSEMRSLEASIELSTTVA